MRISDWSSDVCSSDLFRTWIGRGIAAGQSVGAGHIRWGKAIKGLTGRLGEFTARYTGKIPGRGHRIIVEVAASAPASGYATATGEPLEWEWFISNRGVRPWLSRIRLPRSEEHTSELQSLMRNSYAVFCLKKKKKHYNKQSTR